MLFDLNIYDSDREESNIKDSYKRRVSNDEILNMHLLVFFSPLLEAFLVLFLFKVFLKKVEDKVI